MKLRAILLRSVGITALAVMAAFLGWYSGYISGVENQVYFDAVARATLYEKAKGLDDQDMRQMLEGFLLKQRCTLASDFNYDTYTVNHPIHSGVLRYYKANIDSVCKDSECDCVRYQQPR